MAKKLGLIFGVVFVLVGLLGFVGNPVVGVDGAYFAANTAHNVVHLLLGAALLVMASKGEAMAVTGLKVVGALYLLVAVLGFVMESPLLGLVEYNGADNWLHLVLGVVLLAAGISQKGGSAPAAPQM